MEIILILLGYVLFCIVIFFSGRYIFRKVKINFKALLIAHLLSVVLTIIIIYLKIETDYSLRGIATEWIILLILWLSCFPLGFQSNSKHFIREYSFLLILTGFLAFPVFALKSFVHRNFYNDSVLRVETKSSFIAYIHYIRIVKKGYFLEKQFKAFPEFYGGLKKFKVIHIEKNKYHLILPYNDEFDSTAKIDTIIDLNNVEL